MNECDCSEEYGPCEEHGEVIVQREGASTRTADDLLLLFCEDAAAVLREVTGENRLSPWGRSTLDAAEELLSENDHYGCRWFPEDDADHMVNSLEMVRSQMESELATLDDPIETFWDDGYCIVRVLGGPLVEG